MAFNNVIPAWLFDDQAVFDRLCRWPECDCNVPDYAFSAHNRINFCRFGRNKKENKMTENTYEIKEQAVQTGYVTKDGKFVPVDNAEAVTFVQTGEDAQVE